MNINGSLAKILPRPEEADLLRSILETGIRIVGADEGSLLLFDEARQCLVFALTAGNAEAESTLRGQVVPLGQGITGLAAATLDLQVGATTYKGLDLGEKKDSTAPDAVMAAPMVAGERLIGVVTAVSFVPGRTFGTRDSRVYAEFANLAAGLIEHRRIVDTIVSSEKDPEASPLVQVLSRLLKRPEVDQDRLAKILLAIEPMFT